MTTPSTMPKLPAMTEAELLKSVKELAQIFGWEFYHPYLSIRSAKGWPDVALCRPPRLILAELKREGKRPTPSQEHWLDLLQGCEMYSDYPPMSRSGLEVYVWRPADLEQIVHLLR